jgi:hypothetical protein
VRCIAVWPPLWSSGQSSLLQVQRSGFDSLHYQIFREVVGLERGPLSLVSKTEELLGRKSSGSGLENRHADYATLLSAEVGTNLVDKRRSLGLYSSLADSGHGALRHRCQLSWLNASSWRALLQNSWSERSQALVTLVPFSHRVSVQSWMLRLQRAGGGCELRGSVVDAGDREGKLA